MKTERDTDLAGDIGAAKKTFLQPGDEGTWRLSVRACNIEQHLFIQQFTRVECG